MLRLWHVAPSGSTMILFAFLDRGKAGVPILHPWVSAGSWAEGIQLNDALGRLKCYGILVQIR